MKSGYERIVYYIKRVETLLSKEIERAESEEKELRDLFTIININEQWGENSCCIW